MSSQVEAIYENGVFRPLQPVELPEQKHVTVTIDEEPDVDVLGRLLIRRLHGRSELPETSGHNTRRLSRRR